MRWHSSLNVVKCIDRIKKYLRLTEYEVSKETLKITLLAIWLFVAVMSCKMQAFISYMYENTETLSGSYIFQLYSSSSRRRDSGQKTNAPYVVLITHKEV